MEQKKEFTGVWIPKHILEDVELNSNEKMLYAEIASYPVCYKTNETLAKIMNCSEKTVTRLVGKLIEKSYIKLIKYDGRKRFLKACFDNPSPEVEVEVSTEVCEDFDGRVIIESRVDKMSTQGGQNVHKDNNIDNKKHTKVWLDKPTVTLKDVFKPNYGDRNVNEIISKLSSMTQTGKLDGSTQLNRRMAYSLYKQYGLETVFKAIDAIPGSFYEGKIASVMRLKNHLNELLMNKKKGGVSII